MTQSTPAIRRNWGYWDGRLAHQKHWLDQLFKVEKYGRVVHFDKSYAKGFIEGWASITN